MDAARNTLDSIFLGNSLSQYLFFFGCTLLGVLVGRIVYQVVQHMLLRIAKGAEDHLLVQLVGIIKSPLIVLVFTLGLSIGKQFLTLNDGARQLFENVQLILIQVVVFWFLLRLLDLLVVRYLQPLAQGSESKLDDHLLMILQKGIKVIVIALAFINIIANMGYDIVSLLAGLGIGGLAIALAAQDAVKNLIAGFFLLLDKPFKINDWIEVDGVSGGVVDIGLRSTKLESEKKTILTFPNSLILDSVVTNYTADEVTTQTQEVSISLFTPIDRVKTAIDTLRETVQSVEGTDAESVSVRLVTFGESSLDLEVVYGLTDPDEWRTTIHDVNMGIKGSLDRIRVDLAVPVERGYPGEAD